MAEIGNVIKRLEYAEYSIEFQKDREQRIFALYLPHEGEAETYRIDEISEEILKNCLEKGDIPYIEKGRVEWIHRNERPPSPTQQHYIQDILEGLENGKEIHRDLKTLLENPKYLEKTYELLSRALPKLPLEEFEKCVNLSLSPLLERSKHLPKHQMELAHTISKRYLKENDLKEAMRYSVIAYSIAHENTFDRKNIEEVHSQIFLSFLEKQHGRIRQELEKARTDPKTFHQKLKELLSLKRYCRTGESLQKVVDLFKIAQEVKEPLNPGQKKVLSSSTDLLMKGRTLKHTPCNWPFITDEYRSHLKSYRNTYTQKDPRSLREKQTHYTQKFREFFHHLMTDALIILGPPPCPFTFCSMGSVSREEPTPSSDLEWILLIDKEEERPYFETLTDFLELQCLSFGETPCDHTPLFTSCPPKGGFYWDTGGGNQLIGTPKEIVKAHLHTDIEPCALAYTIHHLAPLYGEEGPFQEFLALKEQYMPLEEQQKSALRLIKRRRKDFFFHRKKLKGGEEAPSLKSDYIEPLFHLLKDLALYYGIQEQNTLDIVDKLPFTEENKVYLKEAISTLYTKRLGKQPLDPTQEEKITCLLLEPLYHVLLENFPPKQKEIDLFKLQLERILSTKSSVETFARHLQSLNLKNETLENYYNTLSNHPVPIECERELFLNALPELLARKLEKVPNPFGQRLILKRKRSFFFQNLSELVSAEKTQGKKVPYAVSITSPFFEGGYLCSDVIDALFDRSGHIKRQAKGTNSRVARYTAGPLDFHFKEKPYNPSKESPFHPGREHAAAELMFRLFGRGTSISELFKITIENHPKGPQKYLVLISETVPGHVPNPETPPDIDPIQLSELFLSLPLLLPGDMRPVNLIATPQKEMISIDNDVSWIKPYTKDGCNLYTALPFMYPDFVLDPEAIESFLDLKPTPLLMNWLKELIIYNKIILGDRQLSTYEETPEKNFFNDPKHYTSTCRFQRGTGGQLVSQFYELQAFLRRSRHRPIKGLEILQTILSLDEERLSLVGEKIYKDYEKAQKNPKITTQEKVKVVTRRRNVDSMSMTQSQGSFFEKIPQSAKELENYTPELAREEIEKLSIINFEGFFSDGEFATLNRDSKDGKGMEGIDEVTQRYLFKAFLLHTFEHLNLSHSILNDQDLERFLLKSGEALKVLDLRHCPNLSEKAVKTLVDRCPNLEKLYLSHCPEIRNFAYLTFFNYQQAKFPRLQNLHIGDCKSLESIQIDAPKLEYVKANDNPRLGSYSLTAPFFLDVDTRRAKHPLSRFGKRFWETYFGKVEAEPPLPKDIYNILQSRCIFWPDKKVYETHLLVLIPETVNGKPFHLNALEELIQSPKEGHKARYKNYYDDVKKELGTKGAPSHWVLMTRDVIPRSLGKKYDDQKALIANYAKKSGTPYTLPKALDAATVLLVEYVQTGKKLYPDKPLAYTLCQEKLNRNRWPVIIGAFGAGGVSVDYIHSDSGNDHGGAGALREFLVKKGGSGPKLAIKPQ